jgi:hypothetical protein
LLKEVGTEQHHEHVPNGRHTGHGCQRNQYGHNLASAFPSPPMPIRIAVARIRKIRSCTAFADLRKGGDYTPPSLRGGGD